MLRFIYIHHIDLRKRRSPENNLSNLMRHRLKERREMLFWPTNYFDRVILKFTKKRQFMTSITST